MSPNAPAPTPARAISSTSSTAAPSSPNVSVAPPATHTTTALAAQEAAQLVLNEARGVAARLHGLLNNVGSAAELSVADVRLAVASLSALAAKL